MLIFPQRSIVSDFLLAERIETGGVPTSNSFYGPGSVEEIARFKQLQQSFAPLFRDVFPDKLAPKTIVIIPSLTLDPETLYKIDGINYYEERLLCLLMLLRMPKTHIIYVTSVNVDPVIIDYYLHLLPGITGYHARQRLTLLSCSDISRKPLTEKILERPLLVDRIKKSIASVHPAHIACFNITDKERTLAVRLGLPVYGCDPDLLHLGTKSGSRMIFHKAGIPIPPGFENITTEEQLLDCLMELKKIYPPLRRAVLKINDGFSGEGNAIFPFNGASNYSHLRSWIKDHLHCMRIIAPGIDHTTFLKKYFQLGGIVEAFIDGAIKTSPSVQCRINPLGDIDIISTHDQIMGGESGQAFIGCTFPASSAYAAEIGRMAKRIAMEMRQEGVLGRFSIDFLSVLEKDRWKHYAIEINLRKGGTTHPFLMLQFLTGGMYNANTGQFEMAGKKRRYYYASDNFISDNCKGLTPHDLIDIAICHDIHYNHTKEEGVMFHLIGALSQFGKLGLVCIGDSPERAKELYSRTVSILENERQGKTITNPIPPSAFHNHPGLPAL